MKEKEALIKSYAILQISRLKNEGFIFLHTHTHTHTYTDTDTYTRNTSTGEIISGQNQKKKSCHCKRDVNLKYINKYSMKS
jgi:hypothetical protein